jgi:hypothetical protein
MLLAVAMASIGATLLLISALTPDSVELSNSYVMGGYVIAGVFFVSAYYIFRMAKNFSNDR